MMKIGLNACREGGTVFLSAVCEKQKCAQGLSQAKAMHQCEEGTRCVTPCDLQCWVTFMNLPEPQKGLGSC